MLTCRYKAISYTGITRTQFTDEFMLFLSEAEVGEFGPLEVLEAMGRHEFVTITFS